MTFLLFLKIAVHDNASPNRYLKESPMIITRLKNILKSNFYANSNEGSEYSNAAAENLENQSNRAQKETFNPPGRSFLPKEAEYYANLELEPGAEYKQIKQNYRKLLSQYHPDKFESDPQKRKVAEDITVRLNEAWSWFKTRHRESS